MWNIDRVSQKLYLQIICSTKESKSDIESMIEKVDDCSYALLRITGKQL